MTEYVPWILSVFTCVNLWLLGEKRRSGFVVGLCAQPIWLVFDYAVGAYGLMPLGLVLGWLYVRGWRKWASAAGGTPATDATDEAKAAPLRPAPALLGEQD